MVRLRGGARAPAAAAAALALLAAGPVPAEPFGEGFAGCGEGATDAAVVECVNGRAAEWDRRLNAEYAKLMGYAGPDRRDRLRAAQRLWVQYRDANCAFYGSREGSIARLYGAECVRAMTEDRARELAGYTDGEAR